MLPAFFSFLLHAVGAAFLIGVRSLLQDRIFKLEKVCKGESSYTQYANSKMSLSDAKNKFQIQGELVQIDVRQEGSGKDIKN
jgi:hypothetical protein